MRTVAVGDARQLCYAVPMAKRTPKTTTERDVRPLDATWLSPKDAAAYLGVSIDTIYDACAGKGLLHSKLGHSTIRLRREWIDAWAETRARENT